MSKGDGLKIGIKFTEEWVGNVAEKNLDGFILPKGIFSASNTVGGYPVTNAFDGNGNTFWYNYWGGNAQWIQIRLPSPTLITGFRWLNVVGYRPKDFKLQGSTNGSTWVDIYTGTSLNADGFQQFTFNAVTYEYYRWTFLSYYNSYVQLAELELRVKVGNEKAFTITGKEYKYVNGNLIDKTYVPLSVEYHPTEPKSILITLDWWGKFNNVDGNLKVAYDASKGNLTGAGGAVESFEVQFIPQGLIQTPNPNVVEHLSVSPVEVVANLKEVVFNKGYLTEHLSVAPVSVTAKLIPIEEINP